MHINPGTHYNAVIAQEDYATWLTAVRDRKVQVKKPADDEEEKPGEDLAEDRRDSQSQGEPEQNSDGTRRYFA
jgi:hypothetical protein